MAAIAALGGASPAWTLGGTLTVVGLGALSGLAGSILALISHFGVQRVLPNHAWAQHVVFAVLLLVVTMRGLRGTPVVGYWLFFPLVAVYGVMLAVLMSRGRAASDVATRP